MGKVFSHSVVRASVWQLFGEAEGTVKFPLQRDTADSRASVSVPE